MAATASEQPYQFTEHERWLFDLHGVLTIDDALSPDQCDLLTVSNGPRRKMLSPQSVEPGVALCAGVQAHTAAARVRDCVWLGRAGRRDPGRNLCRDIGLSALRNVERPRRRGREARANSPAWGLPRPSAGPRRRVFEARGQPQGRPVPRRAVQ